MIKGINILLTLLFISYITTYSNDKLTEDRFIKIYVEISLITEQYLNKPNILQKKKDSLLKEYGITQKDFLSFIDKTDKNPEQYISMWQKIITELKTKREALKKK